MKHDRGSVFFREGEGPFDSGREMRELGDFKDRHLGEHGQRDRIAMGTVGEGGGAVEGEDEESPRYSRVDGTHQGIHRHGEREAMREESGAFLSVTVGQSNFVADLLTNCGFRKKGKF